MGRGCYDGKLLVMGRKYYMYYILMVIIVVIVTIVITWALTRTVVY